MATFRLARLRAPLQGIGVEQLPIAADIDEIVAFDWMYCRRVGISTRINIRGAKEFKDNKVWRRIVIQGNGVLHGLLGAAFRFDATRLAGSER